MHQGKNMQTQSIVTTNLADFGSRERGMLIDLLTAWENQGLPDEFYEDEVIPMFNNHSGFVFLTNEDNHIAMMNGDKLEMFVCCGHCGKEDFETQMKLFDGYCEECKE